MTTASRLWPLLLAAGAAAMLMACEPLPVRPEDGRIGTLRTIGPNVFRNQRPAVTGEIVRVGDDISTGPDSSAIVDLAGGGFLQLDENTDPFIERRAVDGRSCIHIQIRFGRVWIDRDFACVDTPDAGLVLLSQVNVEAGRGTTVVTVYRGRVQTTRPPGAVWTAGQQGVVSQGRVGRVRTLSADELAAIAAWTAKYGTPRYSRAAPQAWCCGARGDVFPADALQCRRAGGRLFGDEREARAACRPPEPQGFCCIKGDITRADRRLCLERGGSFYDNEALARRACRPAYEPTGWCCTPRRQVLPATQEQCQRQGGHFYGSREEAGRDRMCRIE